METVRRTLAPSAGFSREIGFYLSALEKIRAELREIASDLSADELAQRILPGAHQIGALILHIGEAEAGWIQERVAGKELGDEERKFVHWCDTTETDFALKGYSARECIERIDEISRRSREILREFKDDDLERLFAYERDTGERVEVSLRWILHHLIDHEANHRGQISMMKRLLRESQN